MTRIYLIRHAEAEGNLYRRGQGQYDSLITDRGRLQIQALAERFRDVAVDAVYASDLYRARLTASAIYLTHGLPLRAEPGLREVRMGEWEDKPWGLVAREARQQLTYFNSNDPRWTVPGGETFLELRERLVATLTRLAQQHDGETIAVVSHGMALRNCMAAIQGLAIEEGTKVPHCDNTGVSLVEYENGRWNIVYQNDNSHLTAELSTFAGQKWWKDSSGFWADTNLWYRPLDLDTDGEFFNQCRKEAWLTIHGSLEHFDADVFLADARRQTKVSRCWRMSRRGWCRLTFPPPRRRGRGISPLSICFRSSAAVAWVCSSWDRGFRCFGLTGVRNCDCAVRRTITPPSGSTPGTGSKK